MGDLSHRLVHCISFILLTLGVLGLGPADATRADLWAYSDQTTYRPGDTAHFYISSPDSTVPAWIGRQDREEAVLWSQSLTGQFVQAVPESSFAKGCGWMETLSFAIPANWPTGMYFLRLWSSSTGLYEHVPFTIRPAPGTPKKRIVYIRPVSTWQGYNEFGGASYYKPTAATRTTRVSYDRPWANHSWGGAWRSTERGLIHFFADYDMDVYDSVELHRDPGLLDGYRVLVISEHDEYVSRPVYDAYLRFRDRGGNMLVLSANNDYYQIRYAPGERTQICYKFGVEDPMFGVDSTLVTTLWRDPPLNRSEEALVGVSYDGWFQPTSGGPGSIGANVAQPDHWSFLGTGVGMGQLIGLASWGNFVGGEWDRVKAATPPNTEILVHTVIPPANLGNTTTTLGLHDATYYEHDSYYGFAGGSGARVFASGSNYFTGTLKDDPVCRQWMHNLLHAALDTCTVDRHIDLGSTALTPATGLEGETPWTGTGAGYAGGTALLADPTAGDAEAGPPGAYVTGRTGNFVYHVDVPAGNYAVGVGIWCPAGGPGAETALISAEGLPLACPSFHDESTGGRGELGRTDVVVSDGTLDVHFLDPSGVVDACYLELREVWPEHMPPSAAGMPTVSASNNSLDLDWTSAPDLDAAPDAVEFLDGDGPTVLGHLDVGWMRHHASIPVASVPVGAAFARVVHRDLFGNEAPPSPSVLLTGVVTARPPVENSILRPRFVRARHGRGAQEYFELELLPGEARVELYDLRGRRLRILETHGADSGKRSLIWDGADERGHRVARGVYYLRLRNGGMQASGRFVHTL